jgi:hypothetical protein
LQVCITPGGRELRTWLTEFGAGAVGSSLVATDWLEHWGIDLKRLSEDQTARNRSSYRPSELESPNVPALEESVELVREIWSLCEPSSALFDGLDRHLLRLALQRTFFAKYNQLPADLPDIFRADVEMMVDSVDPAGLTREEWIGFLVAELDPLEPKLLEYARASSNLRSPRQHLEVLSRAVLLLRLASGAAAHLLSVAGLGRDDLFFWFDRIAVARGFWEPGETRTSMTDLYEDVRGSVLDTGSWLEGARGTNPSFARWRREQVAQISQLGECERIGMWGFGL